MSLQALPQPAPLGACLRWVGVGSSCRQPQRSGGQPGIYSSLPRVLLRVSQLLKAEDGVCFPVLEIPECQSPRKAVPPALTGGGEKEEQKPSSHSSSLDFFSLGKVDFLHKSPEHMSGYLSKRVDRRCQNPASSSALHDSNRGNQGFLGF